MARTQKSLRKIKSLVFLMILTLILGLTATYAWFSTQRDIEVSGMRLNVEVAESLQISLDGEIWTQSIQIANMRQFYGTYTGIGDGFAIYQAKKPEAGGNTNYVPTELLPVSSAGEVSNGKLQFVQGTIESNADGTTKLTGITACSENDLTPTETVANRQNGNSDHPYLIFDMYLRNISAKTTGLDELLLNAGSAVWVNAGTADDGDQEGAGVAGTGLEYSARVGMVVYGNTISTTATDTADETIGEQIRGLEADGNEVAAIWEPNNKEHTAYVVANNGRGITLASQEVDTYGVKVAVASAATKEIANINSTTDSNLVAVNTFTPEYTTAEDGVDEKTIITNTAGNNLGIEPNQISKVRIYVWLEGQDPDCIDLASTGDKLNVTLKLTKDQTTTTDKNTYVGSNIVQKDGPLFGRKYSVTAEDTKTTWVFFEDGSMEIYIDGSKSDTIGAGECIYGENSIELPSFGMVVEVAQDKTWVSAILGGETVKLTLEETADEITAEDYGGVVTNYASSTSEAQKSVNWRIFHTDGTNIYLIADDYIDRKYLPAGKGNTAVTNISSTYSKGFALSDVTADYAGWADLSSSTIATKWLIKYAESTYTSTKNNMKATAYLLDTSVWNPVFVNSNYAEYAIGGPTLELFTASYNTTHTDKTIDTQVSSATGYQVKWSTDTSYTSSIDLNTSEDLYAVYDPANVYGMWLASPANIHDYSMMRVSYDGYISGCYYTKADNGLRPLVSLKSSAQLEKQEDGTYKIVE